LDVNLKAVFSVLLIVLPEMIKRKRGAVVNIASIAMFHVTVPHVPYAASKAEVVVLTRDLAYEVGRFGIRINAIALNGQRRAETCNGQRRPFGPAG
jgi:3-oxoacyl-[acyl-carrier protein] reductase